TISGTESGCTQTVQLDRNHPNQLEGGGEEAGAERVSLRPRRQSAEDAAPGSRSTPATSWRRWEKRWPLEEGDRGKESGRDEGLHGARDSTGARICSSGPAEDSGGTGSGAPFHPASPVPRHYHSYLHELPKGGRLGCSRF